MDWNKPATVKQVILIVWGPALALLTIWIVIALLGAGQAKRRDEGAAIRVENQRHQEAQDTLNRTAIFEQH